MSLATKLFDAGLAPEEVRELEREMVIPADRDSMRHFAFGIWEWRPDTNWNHAAYYLERYCLTVTVSMFEDGNHWCVMGRNDGGIVQEWGPTFADVPAAICRLVCGCMRKRRKKNPMANKARYKKEDALRGRVLRLIKWHKSPSNAWEELETIANDPDRLISFLQGFLVDPLPEMQQSLEAWCDLQPREVSEDEYVKITKRQQQACPHTELTSDEVYEQDSSRLGLFCLHCGEEFKNIDQIRERYVIHRKDARKHEEKAHE